MSTEYYWHPDVFDLVFPGREAAFRAGFDDPDLREKVDEITSLGVLAFNRAFYWHKTPAKALVFLDCLYHTAIMAVRDEYGRGCSAKDFMSLLAERGSRTENLDQWRYRDT